uniref:Uncharacterized protein n=1 Tax=virus sp. ctnRj46 TaxID=2826814 RepID=A0A8S5R6Y5_9VIRU|nr:MAG TPA: hypothetical protein [virus sp. ctnRj46]
MIVTIKKFLFLNIHLVSKILNFFLVLLMY